MINESKTHWRSVVSQPVEIADFHPLSSALAVEVAAASVCGRLRPHNTDHYLAIRFGRLQETLVRSLAAGAPPPPPGGGFPPTTPIPPLPSDSAACRRRLSPVLRRPTCLLASRNTPTPCSWPTAWTNPAPVPARVGSR